MKTTIITIILLLTTSAFANKNDSIDNSRSVFSTKPEVLDVKNLKWQFFVNGDLIVTNGDGTGYQYDVTERRHWQFGHPNGKIVSYWVVQPKGFDTVYVRHTWDINDKRQIVVKIEQFDKFTEKAKSGGNRFNVGKVLKHNEFILENLQMVTWVAHQDKKQRLVMRFTPGFWEKKEPEQIKGLPISGKDMIIFGNKGRVWAQGIETDAKFTGFITHKGSIFLSYEKFKGAKEMGEVKRNRIKLVINEKSGKKVTIQGRSNFVPEGITAKVYGLFRPDVKTPRLHSVRSMASNKEDQFVKSIKNL